MYRTVFKLFNLVNIINEPTRTIGNSSTLIDPVINSDACRVVDSSTISVDIFISDHKATLSLYEQKHHSENRTQEKHGIIKMQIFIRTKRKKK